MTKFQRHVQNRQKKTYDLNWRLTYKFKKMKARTSSFYQHFYDALYFSQSFYIGSGQMKKFVPRYLPDGTIYGSNSMAHGLFTFKSLVEYLKFEKKILAGCSKQNKLKKNYEVILMRRFFWVHCHYSKKLILINKIDENNLTKLMIIKYYRSLTKFRKNLNKSKFAQGFYYA